MNGKSVKYQYYDKNKRSFITIPRAMAEGLNWANREDIRIINVNINGQEGLFLTKKNYKVFKIIEKENVENNEKKI